MVYFVIMGVEKLILQMFPLISCHLRANGWKYFAKYKDKALSSACKRKDPSYLWPIPTIEIYNLFVVVEIYNLDIRTVSFKGLE